jgi:hypothetical protein
MRLRKAERDALANLLEQGADTPDVAQMILHWVKFGSHVRVDLGGCWEWIGQLNHQGYGAAWSPVTRQPEGAHRHLYRALYGPVTGLALDHLCRNRACVNPAHLEPVTNRENILRGEGPSAINARRTHCTHGHPLTGENLRMDKDGRRRCIECNRQRCREWRERQRATQKS